MRRAVWVALVVLGCPGEVPEPSDRDGDGTVDGEDCGPDDPTVHPGAEEVCDGHDTDCDGVFEPDDVDVDGDSVAVCAGDCDDADAIVHPGARETADRRDDDCNGIVDDCPWDGPGLVGEHALDDVWFARFVDDGELSTFGDQVQGPGDIDGDGYDDVMIGNGFGPAYLWFGPFCDGTYPVQTADVKFDLRDGGGLHDWRFHLVGDLNADGYADFTIANRIFFGPVGRASTQRAEGFEQVVLDETATDIWVGAVTDSPDSPGDIDGDGSADLIVGFAGWENDAGEWAGGVAVYYGPFDDTGTTQYLGEAERDALLLGVEEAGRAGEEVAGVGDVDGDGRADFVVAAPREDFPGSSGSVYLILDAPVGRKSLGDGYVRWRGVLGGQRAGSALAGLGDINGDGVAEVLVGTFQLGHAYVVPASAPAGPLPELGVELSASGVGYFSSTVAVVGDVDGDGHLDYYLGSGDTGFLVYGPGPAEPTSLSAPTSDHLVLTPWPSGQHGARAGDVNGDGLADLLVTGWLVLGGTRPAR